MIEIFFEIYRGKDDKPFFIKDDVIIGQMDKYKSILGYPILQGNSHIRFNNHKFVILGEDMWCLYIDYLNSIKAILENKEYRSWLQVKYDQCIIFDYVDCKNLISGLEDGIRIIEFSHAPHQEIILPKVEYMFAMIKSAKKFITCMSVLEKDEKNNYHLLNITQKYRETYDLLNQIKPTI